MRQYRITTENSQPVGTDNDCQLPVDDPACEIARLQYLGGLGGQERLNQYRQQVAQDKLCQGSNITVTAAENVRIMKQNNIQPGTPEWFKLWFSRPYLTNKTKNR